MAGVLLLLMKNRQFLSLVLLVCIGACHAESFTKSPYPTQRPNASVDDSIAGSTSGQSAEQLDLMDVPLDDSSVRNRSGQSDEQLDVVQSLVAGTFWKRRRRRRRSQPPYDKTKCCECRKYKNGVCWGGLWCCWKPGDVVCYDKKFPACPFCDERGAPPCHVRQ